MSACLSRGSVPKVVCGLCDQHIGVLLLWLLRGRRLLSCVFIQVYFRFMVALIMSLLGLWTTFVTTAIKAFKAAPTKAAPSDNKEDCADWFATRFCHEHAKSKLCFPKLLVRLQTLETILVIYLAFLSV